MPKVRVAGFGVSMDGFSAGIDQGIDNPPGKGGPELFEWFFRHRWNPRSFKDLQEKQRATRM
jgi:hypothetical protein